MESQRFWTFPSGSCSQCKNLSRTIAGNRTFALSLSPHITPYHCPSLLHIPSLSPPPFPFVPQLCLEFPACTCVFPQEHCLLFSLDDCPPTQQACHSLSFVDHVMCMTVRCSCAEPGAAKCLYREQSDSSTGHHTVHEQESHYFPSHSIFRHPATPGSSPLPSVPGVEWEKRSQELEVAEKDAN